MWKRAFALGSSAVLAVGILAACGNDDGDDAAGTTGASNGEETTLTLYSGRSEDLVGPLIEQIGYEVPVEPRYDSKAAQILEEGDNSPADLFFAQDAGELGALANAGLLAELPEDITEMIPEAYRSESNSWAATSARSRVLIYDPAQLDEGDLPPSIDGLLDPELRGQVGYAPTNASFKSFVTGLRLIRGEDGAREWLEAFLANEPRVYDGNGPIVEEVGNGQLAAGLTNHYYWAKEVQEQGLDAVSSRLHFFSDGDPGALMNVAGIGVLESSENKEQAFDFIRQLLTPESQAYFASAAAGEYPLIGDAQLEVEGVPAIDELQPPRVNLDELADVAGTEELLTEVGAV